MEAFGSGGRYFGSREYEEILDSRGDEAHADVEPRLIYHA